MTVYARLLLIGDPDLHYSPALAGAFDARLHIVVMESLPTGLSVLDCTARQRIREEIQERQRTWRDDQLELLRGHGIDVSAEALWSDDPLEDIVVLVRRHHIDLLLKDTHYESALSRALIHPLDWQLLRQAPVPLHLVSLATNPPPRKVVAAIDLSQDDPEVDQLNHRIVEMARQFSGQCDAELHLLQAYDASAGFLAYAAGPVVWTPELAAGRSRAKMEWIGSQFGVGGRASTWSKGAPPGSSPSSPRSNTWMSSSWAPSIMPGWRRSSTVPRSRRCTG